MTGIHTYNILSSKMYYEQYMYMPVTKDNRKEFIVSMFADEELREMSCFVVRCATDLAYMPEERAQALQFNPVWLKNNCPVQAKQEP